MSGSAYIAIWLAGVASATSTMSSRWSSSTVRGNTWTCSSSSPSLLVTLSPEPLFGSTETDSRPLTSQPGRADTVTEPAALLSQTMLPSSSMLTPSPSTARKALTARSAPTSAVAAVIPIANSIPYFILLFSLLRPETAQSIPQFKARRSPENADFPRSIRKRILQGRFSRKRILRVYLREAFTLRLSPRWYLLCRLFLNKHSQRDS